MRQEQMTEKKKTKSQEKKELKELQAELEQLEQERNELLSKLQRVSADYANFQKRSSRQVSEAAAYEKEKVVKSLLAVMDNFEHTLGHAESAENAEAVVKGVQIIYDQMLDILKSHDAAPMNALGEKFDPAYHQAMLQRTDEEQEDGVVLEVFQRGYTLNGRVLRPAKVVVNKLAIEPEQPENTNQ
jgi:molecular chaperone GrpE